jgi:NAD-dependent dihydropyrimidine dehydrogenase PreA subunit
MSDYLRESGRDGQAGEFFGSSTPLTRALVYEDRIPVSSQVTPYEDARRIIQDADFCAVTTCYCRHKKEHLGERCRKDAPVDGICMVLGEGARFLVRRGFAEARNKDAMLETLDHARALGLTHITDNVRERPSFICNCCRCCCELLAGVQMGFADGIAKTPFLAAIDPARCDYCGECLRACNVKCIGLAEDARGLPRDQRHAAPDTAVCLGCGACIAACEKEAIRLVPRARPTKPPRNRATLFGRLLWEKGRLMPFVVEGLKHPLRVLYGRLARRV